MTVLFSVPYCKLNYNSYGLTSPLGFRSFVSLKLLGEADPHTPEIHEIVLQSFRYEPNASLHGASQERGTSGDRAASTESISQQAAKSNGAVSSSTPSGIVSSKGMSKLPTVEREKVFLLLTLQNPGSLVRIVQRCFRIKDVVHQFYHAGTSLSDEGFLSTELLPVLLSIARIRMVAPTIEEGLPLFDDDDVLQEDQSKNRPSAAVAKMAMENMTIRISNAPSSTAANRLRVGSLLPEYSSSSVSSVNSFLDSPVNVPVSVVRGASGGSDGTDVSTEALGASNNHTAIEGTDGPILKQKPLRAATCKPITATVNTPTIPTSPTVDEDESITTATTAAAVTSNSSQNPASVAVVMKKKKLSKRFADKATQVLMNEGSASLSTTTPVVGSSFQAHDSTQTESLPQSNISTQTVVQWSGAVPATLTASELQSWENRLIEKEKELIERFHRLERSNQRC